MQNIADSAPAQLFGDVVTLFPLKGLALQPKPSAAAVAFLKALDSEGSHNLVAIDPAGEAPTEGRTFAPGSFEEIGRWVDDRDGYRNIYYSVNEPVPGAPHKSLEKHDIGAVRAISADIDLPPGVDINSGLRELQRPLVGQLRAAPPSFIVDSGGGIQLLWCLDRKYPADMFRQWAEDQGRGVRDAVHGDAVQNVNRLMRLPGPVNLPTPAKKAKGRLARRSSIIESHVDRRYSDEQLSAAYPPLTHTRSQNEHDDLVAAASAIDLGESTSYDGYGELPEKLRLDFERALGKSPKLAALWNGDASGLLGDDQSRSAWSYALAAHLSQFDDFGPQDFANLAAVCPYIDESRINQRALSRDWAHGAAPNIAKRKDILAYHQPVVEDTEIASASVDTWIDPTQWEGMPIPPRQWEVEGWIPRGEVTLIYGDGGVGKTLLAHQYATAAATGRSWLGQKTRPGRIMCFFCEDSAEELQRRQADINGVLHVAHTDLRNLRLQSRKHSDNALGVWDRSTGSLKLTPAWHQLKKDAVAFGADVVVIDTLSDVFVGDEINRTQVNAFVKIALGRLAAAFGGSVIALGHPSVAGKNSGSGTSGSTAWSNAVRSRLYLRYPDRTERGNIRELEGMKLNYGPKGSLLKIKWVRGAFEVVAGKVAASESPTAWPATSIPALDDAAEAATLAALNECTDIALSQAPNSAHFTPKILKRRVPELLQAYSADEVTAAVERLERKNLIRHDVIGKSTSRHPVKGWIVLPAKSSDEKNGSVFS